MTSLEELIEQSGKNAEDKGFHDDGNFLREILTRQGKHGSVVCLEDGNLDVPEGFWERLYAAYQGNRLMLIVGELVETHEEIRSSKPSIYYGENGKPEGVATELADVQIRLGDYVSEFEEPVMQALEIKAKYNKSRERMHGGRAF